MQCFVQCLAVQRSSTEMLLRKKRHWIIDSFTLDEGYSGPFPHILGRIKVEKSLSLFKIHGQGVDEEPMNILEINEKTGDISVLGAVDYEKHKVLKLTFQAYDMVQGDLDTQLGIMIDIIDSNDNPPKFSKEIYRVFIEESALQGTVVVTFTATDDDSSKDNKDFTFHIISVTPTQQDLEFYVSQNSGVGTLSFKGCLDHEKAEQYTVIVEARDKGKPSPLSSTCSIIVNIDDGNNHPPVITEHAGPGKVEEGQENVLVSRFKVTDEDKKNTKAWKTTFQILGDTDKNFQITTDPETNEGLLYVAKQLNYEEGPVKNLTISAENEIPYFSCKVVERRATGLWIVKTGGEAPRSSSYRMTVVVVDVNESPVFDKRIQQVSVNENAELGKYLTTFTAKDPDITSANTIKYIKGEDPADWITVDPDTGKIHTLNVIDRESSFVKDGVYIITIHAVDDGKPQETGTATLSIQIRDENDNAPYLVVTTFDMCQSDGLSLVNVTASDLDEEPNSGPFTFKLLGDVEDKWSIDPVQGYSVNLVKKTQLHSGYYELQLEVSDLLGQMAVHNLSVTVCDCLDASRPNCRIRKSTGSTVGVGALGVIFFCVLLIPALLLFALLLSTKKQLGCPIPDDNMGSLMNSNTENPGIDCMVPLKQLNSNATTTMPPVNVPITAQMQRGYSGTSSRFTQESCQIGNLRESMRQQWRMGESPAIGMKRQQENSHDESMDQTWKIMAASSAMGIRHQQIISQSMTQQQKMAGSSVMEMRDQEGNSYNESMCQQWRMGESSAIGMKRQQENSHDESMDQTWKIMAASSAMGIRHQQIISQYPQVHKTLTLKLQNLRALELGDYEPQVYADEGDSAHNYELDDISIPDVSFDLDSNLDYRFSALASICMPSSVISSDNTKTHSCNCKEHTAEELNTSSQFTYQETRGWTVKT
ncbi:cadherin-like protein 26 isoform X2 [Cololabis saira]|uniref:cadherin-like protein 26 isoform X2 n=1 Tax=Cololabis saira TaxID=129043 RepID=UPI002AD294F6|nr:cadherin-like protein 26 isoform X2 [Cololabis saira]